MSYSIIFETKFIELSDGRLLHLDRSGCNNDTAGRKLSDFTGKIYTKEKLEEYAAGFMKDGKPDSESGWMLKIGGRCCNYYDYGQHLIRMAKRAVSFEQFISERHFKALRYDGVELLSPETKILTPDEFDKIYYDLLSDNERIHYRILKTELDTENEIIDALEEHKSLSFYVGKKHRK